MNKNGFKEFKEALKDEAMDKQLGDYLAEHNAESKEDGIRLTVQFAAEKGFVISEEDLGIEAAGLRSLDDEEIENLAGGEWCGWDYSCLAANHIVGCGVIMIPG